MSKEEITNIENDVKKFTKETTLSVERIYTLIEDWFAAHFHNNPISRNGEVINKLLTAKNDLKVRISQL